LVVLFTLVCPLDVQAVVAADTRLSVLAHGRLIVRFLNCCIAAWILKKRCKVLRVLHLDVGEIVQSLDCQSVLVSFVALGRELEDVSRHFFGLSFERFAFFSTVVVVCGLSVSSAVLLGALLFALVSAAAAAFCFCDLVVILDTAVVSAVAAALDSSSAMFTLAPGCALRARYRISREEFDRYDFFLIAKSRLACMSIININSPRNSSDPVWSRIAHIIEFLLSPKDVSMYTSDTCCTISV
jgi:hypothetical protein